MRKLKMLLTSLLGLGLVLTGCGHSDPEPPVDPDPVSGFPTAEIVSFFASNDVNDVAVPGYISANKDAVAEADDSMIDWGFYIVYVDGTIASEVVDYKDALVAKDWTVTAEAEGDYILQFKDTLAFVSVVFFDADEETPAYAGLAFYVEEPAPEYTAASAIDAVADLLAETFETTISAHHDDLGDYVVLNFGDSIDADTMKTYSDYFFVPDGFVAVNDWTSDTFDDGTPVDYIDYICGDVVLEYLVYTVTSPAEYAGLYYQVEAFLNLA